MARHFGKNILVLGLTRILSGVILFFVYIKLVNYLGPDEYGKFSLVLAYYIIFQLIMDLGISRFVTKKISEDEDAAALYTGNYFVIQVVLSLLTLGCFFVIPRIFGYEGIVSEAMVAAGFGLAVAAWSMPFLSVLHARHRIDIAAWAIFFCTLLNAGWLLAAVWLKKDILFIFWIYILIGFIYLLIYFFASQKFFHSRPKLKANVMTELVRSGIPFVLIAGFEVMIQKIDVVIQKFFIPFSEIGQYSAAYRLLDFFTFIPAILYLSLFPYLAEKGNLSDSETELALNKLNRYLSVLAIPLGVVTTVYADKIINSLFGQSFAGAITPLRILIWASIVTFFYAIPNVIMAVKKTKQAMKVLGFVAGLNIVLNLIFIPHFGILASSWITLISYILIATAYIYISKQLVNLKIFRDAFWPFIASIIMILVLWPFREANLVIWVALGVAVYGIALVSTGFFKPEDLKLLKFLKKGSDSL